MNTLTPQAAELREHWILHPEVQFLNHGSFGACPRPVQEAQDQWRARMEREPVRFLGRDIHGAIDEARGALAEFVGADAAGLVFVPNATTGVNAVLRSLEFEAGDELLVTDHGYNACKNVAHFVTERAGAKVVVAGVPFPVRGPQDVFDAVLACVTPRTKLVMLDHITSPTALVFPVQELIAALQEQGVLVLIDGAHAPGMLDLDVAKLNADYYTGNCHKWLCAPKGAAFLWVREDRRVGLRPTTISHGANNARPGFNRLQDEFDWCGTGDPSPYLCVPEALRFLQGLVPGGWDEIRKRNRDLCIAGRRLILQRLELSAPAPESMLGAIASIPLAAGDPAAPHGAFDVDPVQKRLFNEQHIEVPIFTWPEAPRRLLRISAQLYNEIGQYEALAGAL